MDKVEKFGYNNLYMCKSKKRGGRLKYKKSVFRSLAMVTQLGLCVVVPIFLFVFAGNYIDSRYGTKTTVFLLILGTLGGARGAYVMAKQMLAKEVKEDETERLQREEQAKKNPMPAAVKPKEPSRVRTKVEETDRTADGEDFDE